jgi:hypothetical protein
MGTSVEIVSRLLTDQGLTIATAEPCRDTFELCLDTDTMQWKIARVWERERVA